MMMQSHPDLGDIPAHWEIAELGDVSDVTKLAGYEFTKHIKYIEDGEIIALRSLNVVNGQLDLSNVKRIARSVSEVLPRSKLFQNDLLLTYTGSKLGDTALIDQNDTYHLAPNVCRLRANEDGDAYFLYVYLRSKVFAYLLDSFKVGSGQPTVPMKNIRKIPIPWPPKEERKYIGDIFSGLTDKIELNTKTNQTLEQFAQAIFISWFVDFDTVKAKVDTLATGGSADDAELAAMGVISAKTVEELNGLKASNPEAFNKLAETASLFPEKLVESEMGLIPEGWEVKPLDKIAHFQNGLALQKLRPESKADDFLPVLKIAQLRQGYCDGKEKARTDIKESCRVYDGDMIFSWSGTLMIDLWTGGNAALNQHLFKVTSEEYTLPLYLFWTKHHLAKFQQIAKDKAVTMGHIKRGHLTESLCVIPPKELRDKMDEVILPLINQSLNLRLQSNQLATLRDTLLPKLLSGEIDLSSEVTV